MTNIHIQYIAKKRRTMIYKSLIDLFFFFCCSTNEIAQAEAYRGKEWIPHWVHTGHLHIDGLKMSKSLKNFVSVLLQEVSKC